MTIDTAVGLVGLSLAFGAAAIRSRDLFWALFSFALLGLVGLRVAQFGLDTAQLVENTDQLLIFVGMLLMAATITASMGLPQSIQDRLIYGGAAGIARFERALREARRPFLEAAATWDASTADKANWRAKVDVDPPSEDWKVLADRVAVADAGWAEYMSTGDPRELQDLALKDLYAKWVALRTRDLGHAVKRGRRAIRLGWLAFGLAATLIVSGSLDLTNGLFSGPPSGRAPVVPAAPPNRTVQLAPLGAFPRADLEELVSFYAERYGLRVEILEPTAIPTAARDVVRDQLVAEALIEVIRGAYPEARDASQVVIGIINEDLHIRERPDWNWAFGMATEGHLGVLSTARMGPEPGPFGHQLESARLRKMVTKYIGILYFDLPLSGDPRSVLFNRILGVPDLDSMGEDY